MVYLTLILEITLAARSPFVGPTISHSSRLAWLIIFIFIFFLRFFWLQWYCHRRKGLHLLHEGGLKAPCQVLREKVWEQDGLVGHCHSPLDSFSYQLSTWNGVSGLRLSRTWRHPPAGLPGQRSWARYCTPHCRGSRRRWIWRQCSSPPWWDHKHVWLLAPSGALIAIPTYYWSSTPLFQITPVLNTGFSLSEPQQLYERQSLDSSAGYMYTLRVQQDITARKCKIVQDSAR